LRTRYSGGLRGAILLALVLGAILLGCAAYEAGNILGGVAGAVIATGWPATVLTLLSAGVAAALLWFQAPSSVARLLSVIVAVMGVAFLVTAWRIGPPLLDVIAGSFVPSLPSGSGVLVLGLIGTTVVPYNIFLGSSLAGGQRLDELRLGLAMAVGLGGLISMGVLIVGTAVEGTFSFEALGLVLSSELGGWASKLFALGLLGAGLSSAITAPLAAAITARDLLSSGAGDESWDVRSWRYRSIWIGVLLTGVVFGISRVQPIPVIILAQALNGVLLPVVAVLLLLAVNDRNLLAEHANGPLANLMMGLVVAVSMLLGISAIGRAGARAFGLEAPQPIHIVGVTAAVILVGGVAGLLAIRERGR
jgi:Mn2+/Fe2+ NRAMP family transporter